MYLELEGEWKLEDWLHEGCHCYIVKEERMAEAVKYGRKWEKVNDDLQRIMTPKGWVVIATRVFQGANEKMTSPIVMKPGMTGMPGTQKELVSVSIGVGMCEVEDPDHLWILGGEDAGN
jgi:hypothetical protein